MPHRIIQKIRSSLSAKIALIVTLPVVIFTSLSAYNNYRHERQMFFRNTEMQLLRIAEGLQRPAETFIIKNDFAELQNTALETAKGADIELIVFFDSLGKVLASNKKKWIGMDMASMYPEDLTENDIAAVRKAFGGGYSIYFDPHDVRYCFVMPLAIGERSGGVMHISLDLTTLNSEIRKTAVMMLLVSFLVSVSLGLTIYFLFHYVFARRIQAVSGAAVRLAAGDMKIRAHVGGTDEIGYLGASFNVLADEITDWRANLEEMVGHRVKELSTLYEVALIIGRSLELSTIMPRVLDHVLDTLAERKGVVVLVDDEGDELSLMAHRGLLPDSILQVAQFGHGCVGDVILKNKPIRVPCSEEEEPSAPPGMEEEKIQSALAAPISARGTAFGAIVVYSDKKGRFNEQDEALLSTIGNQVGVAVENAKLYEKTLELAQVDGLTGLANRRHLMETLKQEVDRAARYSTALSALILDLDKFKNFNDTYGHLKGDELLRAFAALVKNNVRSTDFPGRYGGEEFTIILPNTALKGAMVIAERLRKATESLKISVNENEHAYAGTTVSIGLAELSEGENEEKLLAAADAALYRAKQEGRNRVAW